MKKFVVDYAGGESRYYPGTSVDYMMVTVEVDGDEYELYAEIEPSRLVDENGIPAVLPDEYDDDGNLIAYGEWNPACPDAEHLSIPYLMKAIHEMCDEIGLDPDEVDWYGYDSSDEPTYMMPNVRANYRIR